MLEKLLPMYKQKLSPTSHDKSDTWNDIKHHIDKNNRQKRFFTLPFLFKGLFVFVILFGITSASYFVLRKKGELGEKTDDWQYNTDEGFADKVTRALQNISPSGGVMFESTMSAPSDTIGYSTGGAKDINNFRANIQNNYLPLPTDITYEGLFYNYYFDRGQEKECRELFCPSYSTALSQDPLSKKEQYFMTVGLNSNIKESDFARKKLNLVIVLDISGSMGSAFNSYYYDQFGNKQTLEDSDTNGKKKIQVATESIVALLGHLTSEDRFGMVLFDENAYTAKPLRKVGETDMESIKNHILKITEQGSTNMEAGIKAGTDLFAEFKDTDPNTYENRIIVLTDAMPNTGQTGENDFLKMTSNNADGKIYTTFIGIGVDFNTELIESITKIKGANYYSVHSSKEFTSRMDEGFDYMVTPLVFNLSLKLDSAGYKIEKVYGSPEANEATGEIMKVNTLFPSKTEGGETKGGIVLIQLKKISDNTNLTLSVSYEDRNGKSHTSSEVVQYVSGKIEYYDNTGIKKAVLLTRYVNLMKNWIIDERQSQSKESTLFTPRVNEVEGIVIPDEVELGEWERQSLPLHVSSEYKELFSKFKGYFVQKMNENEVALNDDLLKQEVEILDKLIN
jgi:Ca-activated chloride channel family protein